MAATTAPPDPDAERRTEPDAGPDAGARAAEPPDVLARAFGQVRRAHSTESIEDYVELIDDLIRTRGEARLVELAECLGIAQSSAAKTVARLQRDGFVTSEPYRSIFLTDAGKRLADDCRRRHDIVYRFLLALGVSEETARRDSEGVEHHVSDETLAVFEREIAARGDDA